MSDVERYNRQVVAAVRAGNDLRGDLPLLLLHHVGARSGAERVTPLVYWRVTDTSVAVLASNYGAPRHPAWYYNLLANPTAAIEIDGSTKSVRSRVATGNERLELIDRIRTNSEAVDAAVSRTSRQIPVVILELVDRREAGGGLDGLATGHPNLRSLEQPRADCQSRRLRCARALLPDHQGGPRGPRR